MLKLDVLKMLSKMCQDRCISRDVFHVREEDEAVTVKVIVWDLTGRKEANYYFIQGSMAEAVAQARGLAVIDFCGIDLNSLPKLSSPAPIQEVAEEASQVAPSKVKELAKQIRVKRPKGDKNVALYDRNIVIHKARLAEEIEKYVPEWSSLDASSPLLDKIRALSVELVGTPFMNSQGELVASVAARVKEIFGKKDVL